MSDEFTIYLSNQIESLYSALATKLFTATQNPFVKRVIVVPSPAMKSWLMLQLANDPHYEIAVGLDVLYLDQAMSLFKRYYTSQEKHGDKIPSRLDLAFAIESEIRDILTNPMSKLWEPLFKYVYTEHLQNHLLSDKNNRRILTLSDQLASLFEKYGLFGGAFFEKKSDDWQLALWHRIWQKNSQWIYPYRRYGDNPGIFSPPASGITVHLFGLSFLSKLQNNFFKNISKEISVSYYLISPTQSYWSDTVTDRERRYIGEYWEQKGVSEQERVELDAYLRDRNPLLANFGRLGREMAKLVEESNAHIIEEYYLPECLLQVPIYQELISEETYAYTTKYPLTILQAVQSDMLLLRTPSSQDEISFSEDDKTIQIHSATSRLREVQVIYDLICSIIQKHPDEIAPSDFLVMSPNIGNYVPYIRAVFYDKESVLDAQIMDVNLPAKNHLIQGFLHLIDLAGSRWDVITLLELLEFSAFLRRHQLSTEDVLTLRKWMKDAGVKWGLNQVHRNALLKQSHCAHEMVDELAVGTIEYGFDRLLAGTVYSVSKEEALDHNIGLLPMDGVDGTQADLLGKWIELINSLKSDLEPMCDGCMKHLGDWSEYLQKLYDKYFLADTGEDEEQLLALFANFRETFKDLADSKFPFGTIKHHIVSMLNKESTSYRETHLHAVKFFSMLPMRAIPVKVVILMGMEEGSFPKSEQNISLNLLKKEPGADYSPSQVDFDRYLFLEIMLSARNYFIMTYLNTKSIGEDESAPSLLVTELTEYLTKYYHLDEKRLIAHHPFYSFDKSYFDIHNSFKTFSRESYRMALAHYKKEKEYSHGLVGEFLPPCTNENRCFNEEKTIVTLDIRKLKNLTKSPIQHYLNNKFGLYLDREEDRRIKNEENFSIALLTQKILTRECLIQSSDKVIRIAEMEGNIPSGMLKKLSINQIADEVQILKNKMINMGVNPNQLFSIDAQVNTFFPVRDEKGHWKVPPLEITVDENTTVNLIGTILMVANQGLLAPTDYKIDKIIHLWPEYLFFISLIEQHQLPIEKKMLYVKSETIMSPIVDHPSELLKNLIQYYFESFETPSPLLPGWTQPIINQEHEKLENKIYDDFNNTFSFFYDDYAKWAISADTLPKGHSLVSNWISKGTLLYGDLASQCFASSKSKREIE